MVRWVEDERGWVWFGGGICFLEFEICVGIDQVPREWGMDGVYGLSIDSGWMGWDSIFIVPSKPITFVLYTHVIIVTIMGVNRVDLNTKMSLFI